MTVTLNFTREEYAERVNFSGMSGIVATFRRKTVGPRLRVRRARERVRPQMEDDDVGLHRAEVEADERALNAFDARTIRAVTHLDVATEQVEHAADVIAASLKP